MFGPTDYGPEPALPVGAFQSYEIRSPAATHWRAASCAEIDCPHHLSGWQTTVDERTELGAKQAYYIRKLSGLGFLEVRREDGLTRFEFEAGQRCFSSGDDTHRVQVRPENYLVRGGDWRGNLGLIRRHSGARDWVDDFGEHQQNIADRIEKG